MISSKTVISVSSQRLDPGRERTQSADPLPLPRPEGGKGSGLHDGRDGPQVHCKSPPVAPAGGCLPTVAGQIPGKH